MHLAMHVMNVRCVIEPQHGREQECLPGCQQLAVNEGGGTKDQATYGT